MEMLADLTWVQSTITRHGYVPIFFVEDNKVYMGTVNNSNNTYITCIDLCVVYSNNKHIRRSV